MIRYKNLEKGSNIVKNVYSPGLRLDPITERVYQEAHGNAAWEIAESLDIDFADVLDALVCLFNLELVGMARPSSANGHQHPVVLASAVSVSANLGRSWGEDDFLSADDPRIVTHDRQISEESANAFRRKNGIDEDTWHRTSFDHTWSQMDPGNELEFLPSHLPLDMPVRLTLRLPNPQ